MFVTLEMMKGEWSPLLPEGVWRLQDDGTWRPLAHSNVPYQTGDRRFHPSEVKQYTRRDYKAKFMGEIITVNSNDWSIPSDKPNYGTNVTVHRVTRPPIPSKKEMIQALLRGNDTHSNTLALMLDGHFRLLNRDAEDVVHSPEIAVRTETFDAGKGYVGPNSTTATSDRYSNELYVAFLENWLSHLKGARVNICMDYYDTSKTEAELIADIEKATVHLPV